jgi:hypothetical protein
MHEATSAAFGRKHGTARKGPAASSIKTRSRICSAALFDQWQKLLASTPQTSHNAHSVGESCISQQQHQQGPGAEGELRVQAKYGAGAVYQDMWSRLKATPTFAGWIAK